MIGTFRLDCYNTANVQIGSLTNILVGTWERAINRKGGLDLTIFAEDIANAGIDFTTVNWFRLFHKTLGALGKFYVDTINYNPLDKSLKVTCNDQLIELIWNDVGFNRKYIKQTVGYIVSDIITLAGGWTANMKEDGSSLPYDLLVNNNYARDALFLNENVLQAIEVLRKFTGSYYALQSEGVLRFGQFKALTSAFSLYGAAMYDINKYYFNVAQVALNTKSYLFTLSTNSVLHSESKYMTIIENVTETSVPGNIVNKIIPNGSGVFPIYKPNDGRVTNPGSKVGEGLLHLGLSGRTGNLFKIRKIGLSGGGDNYSAGDILWDDDKSQYFLADQNSVTTYGMRSKTFSQTEIKPITNSAADVIDAANVLYDVSLYELNVNKIPVDSYSVVCYGLPADLYAGSAVWIEYKGVVQTRFGIKTLKNIAGMFYVLSIKTSFNSNGYPIYTLELSSNGEQRSSLAEVISNALQDVGSLKIRPTPNLAYYNNPSSTSPICIATYDHGVINPSIVKKHNFTFGTEVTAVNALKVRIHISRLRAYSYSTKEAGSINQTLGSGTIVQDTIIPEHVHQIYMEKSNYNSDAYWPPTSLSHVLALFQYMFNLGAMPVFVKYNPQLNLSNFIQYFAGGGAYSTGIKTDYNPLLANQHGVQLPAHFHGIAWGVLENVSDGYQNSLPYSYEIQVYLNYTLLAITFVSLSDDGNEAIYEVDITDIVNSYSDYKSKIWSLQVGCTRSMANVFINIAGRVTIQAIQT